MSSIAWWPTLAVLIVATISDLRSRRIPNWLVIPFAAAGIVAGAVTGGADGLAHSLAGMGLAVALAGGVCYLRGMGLGDLKLLAAIGSWIGPEQLVFALIATAIAGGFLAVVYALSARELGKALDGAGELLLALMKSGFRPHSTLHLDNPGARRMPYALAIAVGTMFSFYTQ